MKKTLPIQVSPPIYGYPRHGYRLSIMSLQDDYIPWFFCNYIQLFAVDLLHESKHNIRFNFYFQGPYAPPWLSIYTVPRRSIAKVYNQIVPFIRDQIDEGFYVQWRRISSCEIILRICLFIPGCGIGGICSRYGSTSVVC